MTKKCPVPNCPEHEDSWDDVAERNDPRCICDKPLWIHIHAGEHIHCPVHPLVTIRGTSIVMSAQ